MSPRMRFSAADCGCASRNRVIAPATTRCCWPRRRRRERAIAWSISAPASAPPVLRVARRVAGIELVSGRDRCGAGGARARQCAIANAIRGRRHRAGRDIADARDLAAAGLAADSVDVVADESAVQRCARGTAPRRTRRARCAHVATATTLESWIHAARRILKSGGTLTLIWRADGAGRACWRRSIAASAASRSCRSMATPARRRSACWSRDQGRQGAAANPCRADAQ